MMGCSLLALLAGGAAAATEAGPPPPSFVFMLLDDVGWADFSFIGSDFNTVHSPNVDTFARGPHSMLLRDMHSGGTVCSPTRATVLTGRNAWRDCVHGVWGCFDPTDCPGGSSNNGGSKKFAPARTFTVADAVHAADEKLGYGDGTFIAGKWHLGNFEGPAEHISTPLHHGFDHMFMTQEVAPTSTTNCRCGKPQLWNETCRFGHNGPWACANYWSECGGAAGEGCSTFNITNYTEPGTCTAIHHADWLLEPP